MADRYDIAIVGAGMAGASLAAELAQKATVLLIEAEDHPGYHATGRSAAFWTESYGGAGVLPLTIASGAYLRDHGFLAVRGALTLAREGQEARIDSFAHKYSAMGVRVELLEREALAARVPGLRDGWALGAWEPDCCDIDVAGLHAHYLARARRSGGDVWCKARVTRVRRSSGCWQITLADGREASCDVLVNAAGAWADQVAQIAGASPLGIVPLRRTIAQLSVAPAAPAGLPLVLDVAESFYFKPEAGKLWLSPHDETPSAACDAAPEELAIATAIARLESVVDWQVERVDHAWAGLRSFAPDRLPVYGFDQTISGFFWFAGQGGFGIQTAPAAARLAAGLLCGESSGALDPAPFAPARLAQ